MSSDDSERDLQGQLQQEFIHLLQQAHAKIHHCVAQCSDSHLWWRPNASMNSIANLLLHLSGNLQQWVVDGVPGRVNHRNRPDEFTASGGIAVAELLRQLDTVVETAIATINQLSRQDWLQPRTIQGFDVTVLGAISHSVPHFVGHTHQIVQLTRLQLGAEYHLHWQPEEDRRSVPI